MAVYTHKQNLILGKVFYLLIGNIDYINYKIKGTDDNLIIPKTEYKFYFFNPKIGLLYKSSDNQNVFASFSIANNEPNRNDFIDAINSYRKPKHETLFDTEIQYSLMNENIQYFYNIISHAV